MNITFNISVDTEGLKRIVGNCDSMPPEIVRGFGFTVEAYAVGYAPYDTGWLMNSIQSFMIAESTARIQSDADYDIYQELGTYKMAAHPFLSPAIEQVAGMFLSPSTWSPLIYNTGYGVGASVWYARHPK